MKGISVIICCYNSADRIEDTLNHLLNQQFDASWELIVVDNNCNDNTVEIVKKKWKRKDIPLNVFVEKKKGLIYARQCGVLNAKYNILIFCDDDNWLSEDYLSITFDLLSSKQYIGAMGGQSVAVFEDRDIIPESFERIKLSYAVGKPFEFAGIIPFRRTLWGAGLAIRRDLALSAFDEKYPFLLTGRKGSQISSGDDSEICYRILLMGYNLYFEPKLNFMHFIPKERVAESYFLKLQSGFKDSERILSLYGDFLFVRKEYGTLNLVRLVVSLLAIPNKFKFKKLGRVLFWRFGFSYYKTLEMKIIYNFYRKYKRIDESFS